MLPVKKNTHFSSLSMLWNTLKTSDICEKMFDKAEQVIWVWKQRQ